VAVRIRLRVRSKTTGRELEVIALVNSGFETVKPQLLVPTRVAELLGLWPSMPSGYSVREYMTAGGPVRNYVIPDELEVSVVIERPTNPVLSDLVISPIEDEILISDKLAGRLGVIVYDFGEGIWRLNTDPDEVRRRSEERQIWA